MTESISRNPLQPGDTETQTVGCRHNKPAFCSKNRLPKMCPCPGEVIGRLVLLEQIHGRDDPVFRLATLGTPAAMGEGAMDCRIKSALVGTGLAPGYDFGYLHGDRLLFPAESVNGSPQGFRDIRPYAPHQGNGIDAGMKLSPKMAAFKARQAERAKRLAVRNITIRHDVKAGIPIAEIARKYLITRGWVKQIAGIPPEPRSICQHARATAIVRGRLSGLTFGDLARRYGVSRERVRQILASTLRRRDRRAAYLARQAERAAYRVKRDCDIVNELLAGVSVARLGRRYQITRERVRQIARA